MHLSFPQVHLAPFVLLISSVCECCNRSLQALKYFLFCFPPTNPTAPDHCRPALPLSSSSTKTRRREDTLPYIDYIIQHVPSALIDSTLPFHASTITYLHSTTFDHTTPLCTRRREPPSLAYPFSPIILPNSTPLQTTRSRAFPPAGTATSASSWLPHVYLDYCSAPQYPSLPYRPGLYYLPPCHPRTVCTS